MNNFKALVEGASKAPVSGTNEVINESVINESSENANFHLQRAALYKKGADMLASAGYDKAASYYSNLANEASGQAVDAV